MDEELDAIKEVVDCIVDALESVSNTITRLYERVALAETRLDLADVDELEERKNK